MPKMARSASSSRPRSKRTRSTAPTARILPPLRSATSLPGTNWPKAISGGAGTAVPELLRSRGPRTRLHEPSTTDDESGVAGLIRLAAALASTIVAAVGGGLPSAAAQTPSGGPPIAAPLTVAAIYGPGGGLAGNPPSGFEWAPDSSRALYRSADGDIVSVDGGGKTFVMVGHTRLNVLSSVPGTETDR